MTKAIKVCELEKYYKDFHAVKNINFSVDENTFFAFLGENGAGKSTTINIITTLLEKTSGRVIVNGNKVDSDDNKIRKNIGVVFQGSILDGFLTVRENLIVRGKLYDLSKIEIKSKIEELSTKIGLNEFIDKRYGRLSGGQKRRADIARALIHEPKILILDEPTIGLDPYTRKCFWEVLCKLKSENNITVFFTTHYMHEAENADHIVIIDKGKIKTEGSPNSLKEKNSIDKLIMVINDEKKVISMLEERKTNYEKNAEVITLFLQNSIDAIEYLTDLKDYIVSFEVIQGNMDDVFLNIVGSNKQGEGK